MAALGTATIGLIPILLAPGAAAAAPTAKAAAAKAWKVPPPETVAAHSGVGPNGQAPAPTAAVSPLQAAKDQAQASKTVVPVGALTTAKSLTVANPDGSVTENLSPTPVRWHDSTGGWHPFDLTLVAGTGGVQHARSVPPETARIAGSASALPVQVGTGASTISFGPAGAAPVNPVGLGSTTAGCPAALSGGRDVTERLLVDGVEETATLASPAASGSWSDTFVLPVGVRAMQTATGVAFVDGSGNQVAVYVTGPPPTRLRRARGRGRPHR